MLPPAGMKKRNLYEKVYLLLIVISYCIIVKEFGRKSEKIVNKQETVRSGSVSSGAVFSGNLIRYDILWEILGGNISVIVLIGRFPVMGCGICFIGFHHAPSFQDQDRQTGSVLFTRAKKLNIIRL